MGVYLSSDFSQAGEEVFLSISDFYCPGCGRKLEGEENRAEIAIKNEEICGRSYYRIIFQSICKECGLRKDGPEIKTS